MPRWSPGPRLPAWPTSAWRFGSKSRFARSRAGSALCPAPPRTPGRPHPTRQENNGEYRILVPKVDTDGNELAGIRLIPIRVSLATYTGWNLQGSSLAEDELCGLLGSYIPFAKAKYEREKIDDPRLSVEERYQEPVDYVQAIIRETESMVRDGFLLAEDAERIISQARNTELFAQTGSK